MNKENNDKVLCPICSSCANKQIYTGLDKAISKFSTNYYCRLFLFRCRDCGAMFLDNIKYNLQEIHEAYWKMLINNMGNDYSIYSEHDQESLLDALGKYMQTGNLIEVGCGDGKFLQLAQKNGWRVTGVEVSARAADLARQKYGLNVLEGSLEQVCQELEGLSFDIVIMWGVIEHLLNPIEVLQAAKLLLRKGGILIIFTPNANSIFHKLARGLYSFTFGLIKFPMERVIIAMHTLYFTPDTLRRAVMRSGFAVRAIKMEDINLDFIFKAHKNFWWANKILLNLAKLLQRIGHQNSMDSHMLFFAEST